MNKETKIALLIGGAVAAGAVALVLAKQSSAGKYFLQIQASEGGTTDPSPSPSGILKSPGEVITIRAIPNSGYTVGTWILDGIEIGNQSSIQVTMNMDHTVVVTFWQGGEPPASYPVAITPVGGSATAWGFYGAMIDLGTLNVVTGMHVHNCDQNWTWDNWAQYPMQFKVIDASGKGVPNIDVTLFPDLFPDNGNNVGLVGYLALNLWPHTNSDPLILTTDANGIVTVNLTYVYGLTDSAKKLCKAAQLYVNTLLGPIPLTNDVWDGRHDSIGIFVNKGGEGITNDHPSTMGSWAINSVRASIQGSSIPATQMTVYCGFHAKML